MRLQYSAYTLAQDGETFDHEGSIDEARALAERYARDAFPAWGYEGHGPTIVVLDVETGERVFEKRL